MSRAVELQPQVNTTFSDVLQSKYAAICFVLGKTYLKAFENALELVPNDTELVISHGRIGEKQAQLKDWLWRDFKHSYPQES